MGYMKLVCRVVKSKELHLVLTYVLFVIDTFGISCLLHEMCNILDRLNPPVKIQGILLWVQGEVTALTTTIIFVYIYPKLIVLEVLLVRQIFVVIRDSDSDYLSASTYSM